MKFIDWFAGVGGFRRGMELAGHECVGFCEFDKYAVMSYTAMHLCTQEQLDYLATLPLKERQKERIPLSGHLRCRKTTRIYWKPLKPVFQSYVHGWTTRRRKKAHLPVH